MSRTENTIKLGSLHASVLGNTTAACPGEMMCINLRSTSCPKYLGKKVSSGCIENQHHLFARSFNQGTNVAIAQFVTTIMGNFMVSMEKELVYILYLSIVLKLICGKAKICSEKQFKILKWRF